MTESYEIQGFGEAFEDWLKRDDVIEARRIHTIDWAMSRSEDPYQGARRVDDMPNYWFARVPHTATDGEVVCCSFWIFEKTKSVKCDNFGILSEPI